MSLLALSRTNGEAMYAQIRRVLEQEIRTLLKPGALLPPESELASRFAVNRHTLRRAMDGLIARGLIERRHGKGSVVLGAPLDYDVHAQTRFTDTLEALGRRPESRVIRKLVIPARGGVATRLALEEGAAVIWVETLRLADERPFCVISHFLPAARVPGLIENYAGGSLHEFLRVGYGARLRRAESLLSAALPLGDDASLLAMPQHQPVLRVKSINVDERDGTRFEYALTRFRADRVQLRISP